MRILFTAILIHLVALTIAQPTNDNCENAFTVPTIDGYCSQATEFTTAGATSATSYGIPSQCSPSWDGEQNDVWFIFNTTLDIIDITISVNGDDLIQPQIAVYRGDCQGFAELICATSSENENNLSLDILALDPFETYYLRINAATTGNDGAFQLCIDQFSQNIISNVTTDQCEGILYDTGGPDGTYGAFENFAYSICPSDPHDCIAITFTEYDIEPIFDNLSIYDGADTNAPLVASIDGESLGNQEFVAIPTSGCVTIGFTTDGGNFRDGFELTWACTQGGCPAPPPNYITCTGTFYDSGGPDGNYSNEEAETYIICPEDDYTCLNLNIVEYDIENAFDTLNIYQGIGINSPPIASIDGQGSNLEFFNEGCFTITFSSDISVNNAGWQISWECLQEECPPDGSDIMYPDLTDCSGTFYDSGGPDGNYLNNENWDFSICPQDTNMCLILNVITTELPTDGDALFIYDGPEPSGTILGAYFTPSANDEIQTASGCVTVAFQSNAFTTSGGFEITWQCTPEACTIDSPLNVTPNVSETELGEVIAADGVIISNISLNCPDGAYGVFDTPGNCNLGMESGIVLTNGSAIEAAGPSGGGGSSTSLDSGGDSDLDSLLAQSNTDFFSQDACVLEFDIYATTDILSFNYSFGSEEYPEFAPPNNSGFNDVFGFFISGPGIDGPYTDAAENIALIPNSTTPVSINNVNVVTNSEYYIDNQGGLCTEYDAFTTVLTATANVIPCETYHIKLAVGDVGDGVFDSGVFIQAQSLSTGAASISPSYEFSPEVDAAIEGCATGFFNISLDAPQADTTVIYLNVQGTATNGDDFTAIPDSLIFLPGDSLITIPVNPLEDGIIEGGEQAIIYLITPTECGNIQTDSAVIDIQDFIEITTIPESPITTCENSTISIEAQGAVDFVWSTGDSTSIINISPTENTTYYVTGTVGTCQMTDSIEVIIADITLDLSADAINCTENSQINTTITGGNTPYSFAWDTPNMDTIQNPSDIPPGTYTLLVTDANGCTASGTVEAIAGVPFDISVSSSNSSNCTEVNGQINIEATGGTPPFQYSINDGTDFQSEAQFTGIGAGIYTVLVQDMAECTETAIVEIREPNAPNIQVINSLNPNCGEENGSIEIILSGGNPNFEYSIDGGNTYQGSNIFEDLPEGNYDILVEDFFSCQAAANVVLEATPPLEIADLTAFPATCGDNNGKLDINVIGGTPPYMYSLDGVNFQDISNFSELVPAVYQLEITDAAGCEINTNVLIPTNGSLLIGHVDFRDPSTCEVADGTINVFANGGTPPYGYSIDNGANLQGSSTFSNLAAGMYNILITDANECVDIKMVELADKNPPQIIDIQTMNTDCGAADGSISIMVEGGSPNYQYSIDGGATFQGSNTFDELEGGNYQIIVEDFLGCRDESSIIISTSGAPIINSINSQNPLCGAQNGSITITVTDGTPAYEYSIDGGMTFQTSTVFDNLSGGVYDLVVRDAAGCEVRQQTTLTDNGALTISDIDTENSLCGEANATIDIFAGGGTPPYQYSLDNGMTYQATGTFENLAIGTYNIVIKDENDCTDTQNIEITSAGAPTIDNIELAAASCGSDDGSINITASGGTAAYQYSINGGTTFQGMPNFEGLSAGTYEVIVEDTEGCQVSEAVEILSTTAATPQIMTDGPTTFCFYDDITLDAGAYETYAWSNGADTPTITTATAGTYSVTVTDENNCIGIAEVTLNVTDEFTVEASEDITIDLGNTFDLDVIFVNNSHTYSWLGSNNDNASGANVTFTATEVGVFTYTVTATFEGCQVTDEVTVTVADRTSYEVPNAFSPNNDTYNEYFTIVKSGAVNIVEFKVFNRWGELVYDDPTGKWDGTFRGVDQVSDVYAYFIIVQPTGGEQVELKGSVLLMR